MSNLFDVFFGRGIQNSHLISNIMIVTGCFVFCATLIIIVQDLFTTLQCEVCILAMYLASRLSPFLASYVSRSVSRVETRGERREMTMHV